MQGECLGESVEGSRGECVCCVEGCVDGCREECNNSICTRGKCTGEGCMLYSRGECICCVEGSVYVV